VAEGTEAGAALSGSEAESAYRVRLASAKLIGNFVRKDRGTLNVEKDSVYGAAILIPQLARSAEWPKFLTFLTFRAYIFHVLNIVVQGWLLLMIAKEESVMDLFGGQMYLCDFGAFLTDCPGSPGCIGPGGTPISAPRMYPWAQWNTRNFVRDSLKAVFPEKLREIAESVDPGEYGVESYGCRWLCCFIYMMSVMNELHLIVRMWMLLFHVPTSSESWIQLEPDASPTDDWEDQVRLGVAGMPRSWKLFNALLVLGPKCMLWKITAEAGVTLLMETSSIEDLIVNSVALSFVLNIDEMICETLMSDATRVMLEKCEDFNLYEVNEEDALSESQVLELHDEQQSLSLSRLRLKDAVLLLPPKLLAVVALTGIFVYEYYWTHCFQSEYQRYFSRDMFLPTGTDFGVLNAFFPRFFRVPTEDKPYWQMPKTDP